MNMTDPLADMFTRIRNAAKAKHETVDIPSSRIKETVADILKREGYIQEYKVLPDQKQGILRIRLKYIENRTSAIEGIRRISKPSIRVYLKTRNIRPVRNRMGISILSTSQGLMTNREARLHGIGGEILCEVW
jgi:small subunit ribosomal protein S8